MTGKSASWDCFTAIKKAAQFEAFKGNVTEKGK